MRALRRRKSSLLETGMGVPLGDRGVVAAARELAGGRWHWCCGPECWRAHRHNSAGSAAKHWGVAEAGEAALPSLSKNRTEALLERGLTLCCRKGFTAARSCLSPCWACEQGSQGHGVCAFS